MENLEKKRKALVQHLTIAKARVKLGQLVSRLSTKREYFILEKNGIPVIGIMNPDELEDYLELQSPRVTTRIRKATAEFKAGKHRDAHQLLSELEAKVRLSKPQRRKA